MLTHSRPQVRKQTILVFYRVVLSWPQVTDLDGNGNSRSIGAEEGGAEDAWIEKLRERLGDDDAGVVAATVNLICELARKEPKRYLGLAPELFGLLTESSNNWMLIKIIKLVSLFPSSCSPGVQAGVVLICVDFSVCRSYPSRASFGTKAASTPYGIDSNNACHVFVV